MLFYVACKNVNPLHTHTNTLHLFLLTRAHTSKCVTWFWILDVVVAVAPHSGLLQISRYPFSSYFSCSLQTLITTEILAWSLHSFFSHISVSFLTFYDEIIVANASFHMKTSNQKRKNITSVFLPSDANEFVFSFIAFFGSFTYQQTNKSENHWHSSMRPFPWELCHIVIFIVIKPYLEPFGFLNHYSRFFSNRRFNRETRMFRAISIFKLNKTI